MKGLLRVTKIMKQGNLIQYQHESSIEISRYIKEKLYCHYSKNIEAVPDSIAVLPFISDVLPFIWLTDSVIEVDEIDKDFFECVHKVREGYKEMYPMLSWGGKLKAKHIVDNRARGTSKKEAVQLFSSGVDAFTTFFRHFDEKPDFITVWGGGDVNINDVSGWKNVSEHIQKVAGEYGLQTFFIKSNFLEFLNIDNLNEIVLKSGDQWWHGFQHALALLGLSAPISMDYQRLYIASSYPAYMKGQYTLASDPSIDNHVKFNGIQVIHDGYELDRQDKVRYLVEKKEEGFPIGLRVCWESNGGSNCCSCEKCYRTILEIVSEGGNPNQMGFVWDYSSIRRCRRDMMFKIRTSQDNILFLRGITEHLQEQKSKGVIGTEYDWFCNLDFDHFNDLPIKKIYHYPLIRKIRYIFKKVVLSSQ